MIQFELISRSADKRYSIYRDPRTGKLFIADYMLPQHPKAYGFTIRLYDFGSCQFWLYGSRAYSLKDLLNYWFEAQNKPLSWAKGWTFGIQPSTRQLFVQSPDRRTKQEFERREVTVSNGQWASFNPFQPNE